MANPTPQRREGSASCGATPLRVPKGEVGMDSKSMAGWIGFAGILMMISAQSTSFRA